MQYGARQERALCLWGVLWRRQARPASDVDRVDAASTYAAAMAGGRTAHGMTVMGVDVVSMWSPAAASCVIAETHRNLASEYCGRTASS